MSVFKNAGIQVFEYMYDFDVDGGATGDIVLSSKPGRQAIPANAIVLDVHALVLTACTSGGSATVHWGNAGDRDGYSGTTVAVATLAAGYAHSGGKGAGALLWDDTNDVAKPYVPASADRPFSVSIATAALTAGKIAFMVTCLVPGQD